MDNKPKPKEPDLVACEICLEEIPVSASIHQEADEYVQHYCGIECYSQWKRQQHPLESD
ncbi:MAG: DUF3330 domain-containing protein [Gammaproteobacteria bacterium]|nr:DUF3330 domain-containing protein [Gammaproteobacteria bacterium]MDH5802519.1 DUF3330 domain-containing protein [Gammaproteobacteria bacterium]